MPFSYDPLGIGQESATIAVLSPVLPRKGYVSLMSLVRPEPHILRNSKELPVHRIRRANFKKYQSQRACLNLLLEANPPKRQPQKHSSYNAVDVELRKGKLLQRKKLMFRHWPCVNRVREEIGFQTASITSTKFS